MTDPILSPSEQEFRQRVRDLEAGRHATAQAVRWLIEYVGALHDEVDRHRRAVRTLARLQPARVSRAVMEVMNDE